MARQISQMYKVMLNGSSVMSVHGQSKEEALAEAERQLDKPGRRDILKKWKAEGCPLARDKKFENHVRRNALNSAIEYEQKIFNDQILAVVSSLRRMADEIERNSTRTDWTCMEQAREAHHCAAWGAANLNLDRLSRSAAAVDQAKAMLQMMEELEVE